MRKFSSVACIDIRKGYRECQLAGEAKGLESSAEPRLDGTWKITMS